MKATDVINFINEDKFSKYTAKQIYDELGAEDFIEYLRKLILKAVKLTGIDYLVNIKPVAEEDFISPNIISVVFENRENRYIESLFISFHVLGEYTLVYSQVSQSFNKQRSQSYSVPSNETNIINRLIAIIKYACESDKVNKLRQKYLKRAKK